MTGNRLAASVSGGLALVAAGAVLVYAGTLLAAFLAGEDKNEIATTFFVLTMVLVLLPGLTCVVWAAIVTTARGFRWSAESSPTGESTGHPDTDQHRRQATSRLVKTLVGWGLLWLSLLGAVWFLSILTEIAVSSGPDDITQLGEVLFPAIVGVPGVPAAIAAWGGGALLLLAASGWRSRPPKLR